MKYRRKKPPKPTNPKPFKMVYARKEQYLIQSFVTEKQVAKISLGHKRTQLFLKYICGFHSAVGFASPLVSL